ncbi:MAG: Fic family protein [Chloroflexota bacterium]
MPYKFSFTPAIVRYLQSIERVRELVRLTILPPVIAEQLRIRAHIHSTHYSTRIEGNRLTLKETEQVIQQGKLFPGRERDVREVERYYLALQQVEKWVEGDQKISEAHIRKLHALLFAGKRAKPTPYRDGQNIIREASGEIVYMPPEAHDVPGLMIDLISWLHRSAPDLPVPVIAGVVHYQFVTIHPFFDGNGRTARTLATWVLHQGGYDLGKFYSLEEFYAEDLNGYYDALVVAPHHNYYFGRNEADITTWLDYFLKGMAVVFEQVADEVKSQVSGTIDDGSVDLLRPLDHRARRVLGLFSKQDFIQSSDVANLLGISNRQARDLLTGWVNQSWLEIADPSRRGRKYGLMDEYKKLLKR